MNQSSDEYSILIDGAVAGTASPDGLPAEPRGEGPRAIHTPEL